MAIRTKKTKKRKSIVNELISLADRRKLVKLNKELDELKRFDAHGKYLRSQRTRILLSVEGLERHIQKNGVDIKKSLSIIQKYQKEIIDALQRMKFPVVERTKIKLIHKPDIIDELESRQYA
jgi:hypothetical protein